MATLRYFDNLFTSGPLPKGVAVKYARQHHIQVDTVQDYFNLILQMSNARPVNMKEFQDEMWNLVHFSKKVLRVGQIIRLQNIRFTGNRYRILALHNKGMDVENVRQPKYKFYDLDYNSIDRILVFNL